MLMNLNELKIYLGEDWIRTTEIMKEALGSDIELLNTTNDAILSNSGKQMRPLISLMIAKACNAGVVTEDSHKFAAAVELLHNATLLHDDVADASDYRRGVPTVNSIFGPSVSVLLGDFWLVAAMNEILDSAHGTRVIRIFSKTLSDLAEGEMLQLQKAQSADTTQEDYLRIIYDKTGSLFEVAALSAAISVGASPQVEQAVCKFATCLGSAFQIKDDIFDYSDDLDVGKPLGVDIMEQKITMPLLGALSNVSQEEQDAVRHKIMEIGVHPEYKDFIISFVKENGGVSYAVARLEEFISEAVRALDILPDSQAKEYLVKLAYYVGQRNK